METKYRMKKNKTKNTTQTTKKIGKTDPTKEIDMEHVFVKGK